MRELERQAADSPASEPTLARVGVVGRGRLGRALAEALRRAGVDVDGPAARGETPACETIVLCVPDAQIPAAAAAVAGATQLVGHTSGATPLSALEPAGAEAFGIHPLQTFAGEPGDAERFAGAGCAIAGSSPSALETARRLALLLGMEPFEIEDGGRAAYHAAASVASNFLVTLQHAAETIAAAAGLEPQDARRLLAPLVRSTVDNWALLGPERALTGPVARGDELTLAAQRAAVRAAEPRLLALFDALVEETRALAREGSERRRSA
jgi:predicted short-subunit dehydrogenase-like oxidoreductase (DUF2520 family)